jgi:hypothetical protein
VLKTATPEEFSEQSGSLLSTRIKAFRAEEREVKMGKAIPITGRGGP